jgi:hypothetical protein
MILWSALFTVILIWKLRIIFRHAHTKVVLPRFALLADDHHPASVVLSITTNTANNCFILSVLFSFTCSCLAPLSLALLLRWRWCFVVVLCVLAFGRPARPTWFVWTFIC